MKSYLSKYPMCTDHRKCFGAVEHDGVRRCRVLSITQFKDKCTFCKPYKDFTNGVWYHTGARHEVDG